jgi:hypothetical protein
VVTSAVDEIVGDCLAVRVRLIGRAMTSIYDHALENHGLGKVGPCSPARIGDVLQLDRSTVSRNLSLLLKHDWISAVSSDAKGVREVALTSSGRKKIEAVMPDWRRAQREATQLVGADGVKAIRMLAGSVAQLPGD